MAIANFLTFPLAAVIIDRIVVYNLFPSLVCHRYINIYESKFWLYARKLTNSGSSNIDKYHIYDFLAGAIFSMLRRYPDQRAVYMNALLKDWHKSDHTYYALRGGELRGVDIKH